MAVDDRHVGTSFDDWLEEEGILEETHAAAAHRALADRLAALMAEEKVTPSQMAKRMGTSRTQVYRLTRPATRAPAESPTLATISKAAAALGRKAYVVIE